ncbi:hypothetical protein ABL78_3479 [Leptomonas seymouri]|uniref:Uncharacterized protein n=1 Tax=Leptomonas seymouri TaxID=5684 RepID=A0A0N1PDP9_LEPSE|nr:hypothetical protein ABL78_3479 [Leptomonas seymouri]|eukprot:KPI87448.1 hypothetical protein ABL78_3479 [Leptomonas seymouri]
MFKRSRLTRTSRYPPIVGCAFLVEALYGSKYSANFGIYNMPYVYVKTILLCATGHGLEVREGRYIHGLIELLIPSKVSQDNLTKLELLQFVDAIPTVHLLEGHETELEEDAEVQATIALMSDSGAAGLPRTSSPHSSNQRYYSGSSGGVGGHEGGVGPRGAGTQPSPESAAAALRRSQQEREDDDAVSIERVLSFVSPATFPPSIARVLIYDAVCTCVADGLYSAKEKERVALVSSHIGLSTAVRGQIEKLALQEKVLSIRKRRQLLLEPPPASHTPREAERSRQVSNVLFHSSTQGAEGRRRGVEQLSPGPHAGARGSQVLSDKAASAAASGRPCGPAEDVEERRKVEAAKKLLRRARRHKETQNFFTAGR